MLLLYRVQAGMSSFALEIFRYPLLDPLGYKRAQKAAAYTRPHIHACPSFLRAETPVAAPPKLT